MNQPPDPPPHPLELAAALVLLALELVLPLLASVAALLLALARWKPALPAAGATAPPEKPTPVCAPALQPIAKRQPRRRTRRTHAAQEAQC